MPDQAGSERPHQATLRRTLSLCLLALLVMLPWPLAGIAALHTQFDEWGEAAWMFGGLTAIPALVLALFGARDSVYFAVMVIVWVGAWVAPPIIWGKHTGKRGTLVAMLASQSGFSLVQAMVGAMMVIGKSV